jgi:DNA repair protein RecO (recombination protein O)
MWNFILGMAVVWQGHLELFVLGRFILAEGRRFDVITTAETVNNFSRIRDNLKKTSLAYFWAELIDKLTQEHEPNFGLFSLIFDCFTWLNKTHKKNLDLANLYFMIKLTKYLGFEPELSRCVHCLKKLDEQGNSLSLKLGGIICKNCKEADRELFLMSSRQIKLLRLLGRHKIDIIEKVKAQEREKKFLVKIIQYYLENLSERKFNSTEFIRKLTDEGQGRGK